MRILVLHGPCYEISIDMSWRRLRENYVPYVPYIAFAPSKQQKHAEVPVPSPFMVCFLSTNENEEELYSKLKGETNSSPSS